MKVRWTVEDKDVRRIKAFMAEHGDNAFVRHRIRKNVEGGGAPVTRESFFFSMLACLVSTQQKAGPASPMTRFLCQRPFPLQYEACLQQRDVQAFIQQALSDFGGLRRLITIGEHASENLDKLEAGLWDEVFRMISALGGGGSMSAERAAADFVQDHFKGFGPKQARNLLQTLGLTKYEIPIDSRFSKWLHSMDFPLKVVTQALSDKGYYCIILDGVQALCRKAGELPCVLDAAVFSSFDGGGWSETNALW